MGYDCSHMPEVIRESVEKDAIIAQLRADIAALVEFAEAELAVSRGIIGFDLHNDAVDRFRSAAKAIHPIIERYRDE